MEARSLERRARVAAEAPPATPPMMRMRGEGLGEGDYEEDEEAKDDEDSEEGLKG